MTNMNITPNFISCATERELLTLSLAEIIDGLMADYKSFCHGNDDGIRIPESKQEGRMSHACILYIEGLRLAHSHLELAKRLVTASLYDTIENVAGWYAYLDEEEYLKCLLKRMAEGDDLDEKEMIVLTSIFRYNTRAVCWLAKHGELKTLEAFLKGIKDYEGYKAVQRKIEMDMKIK